MVFEGGILKQSAGGRAEGERLRAPGADGHGTGQVARYPADRTPDAPPPGPCNA
jgi:hypothetical protein